MVRVHSWIVVIAVVLGVVSGCALSEDAALNEETELSVPESLSPAADKSVVTAVDDAGTKTIRVPADVPRIQQAIDQASSGDMVLVAAGTYREQIVLRNGIRLVGAGWENTLIDGGCDIKLDRSRFCRGKVGVRVEPGASRATLLEGFTITNGTHGLLVNHGAPLIRDCSITANRWVNVILYDADARIENTLIGAHEVPDPATGQRLGRPVTRYGIYARGSRATLVNLTVTGHQFAGIGWLLDSEMTVENTIVASNRSGFLALDGSGELSIRFSNVHGNRVNYDNTPDQTGDQGNISSPPEFVAENDFRLQDSSPSRNTGRLRVDMGVFGDRLLAWLKSRIVFRSDESDSPGQKHPVVPDPVAGRENLILTFEIPESDPAYPFLFSRSFIFDNAMAVVLFSIKGDFATAKKMLTSLARLQNDDGSFDGSFNTADHFQDQNSRFTGNIAWVGYAFSLYRRLSNDEDFMVTEEATADYLLTLQERDPQHPAFGALRAGPDKDRYTTEHQVHASFFLFELGQSRSSDAPRYAAASQLIRDNLRKNHFRIDHFTAGIDPHLASDANALGALAFLADYHVDDARAALQFNDIHFGHGEQTAQGSIHGLSALPVPNQPFLWSETTLAAALAWRRLGEKERAERIRVEMQTLLSPDGGILYAFPETDLRDDPIFGQEFNEWPSIAPTVWFLLLRDNPSAFYQSFDR